MPPSECRFNHVERNKYVDPAHKQMAAANPNLKHPRDHTEANIDSIQPPPGPIKSLTPCASRDCNQSSGCTFNHMERIKRFCLSLGRADKCVFRGEESFRTLLAVVHSRGVGPTKRLHYFISHGIPVAFWLDVSLLCFAF